MRDYRINLKMGQQLTISRESYFIPNVYLVGYGRTQTYQVCCLTCEKPFFSLQKIKEGEDLFCEECYKDDNCHIPESNISKVNYIGNIVGWIVNSEGDSPKRTRNNYKKAYQRDEYTCRYCGYNLKVGTEFRPLHIDHIRPFSVSGGNGLTNLVVACSVCNLTASSKWFQDFLDKKTFIIGELRKKGKTIYTKEIYDRDNTL